MQISINIVRHLLQKVEVAGHAHLLQSCPDYHATLALPADSMVAADQFLKMIAHVDAAYPEGRLAYDIEYKHFSAGQINMLGALGQMVQVSPTLETVSEAFYRYYGEYNTIFSPRVERRGQFIASKIETTDSALWRNRAFQITIEMFLYGMVRIVREWFSDPIANPVAFSLPYLMPGPERAVMAETMGVEPSLGDACALVFRAEVYLMPLPYANPQLWEHLKVYMDRQTGVQKNDTVKMLESYIKSYLGAEPGDLAGPNLKAAARSLSLSERSLQRKLKGVGTSFQAELDKVRLEVACQLLSGHQYALKEIAFKCGFRDANSFFRAFKKWTGQTPEEWRKSKS